MRTAVERIGYAAVALSLTQVSQLVHERLVTDPPQVAEPRAFDGSAPVSWIGSSAGSSSCGTSTTSLDRAFERRRAGEDPAWVYWLDRDEIDVMAGRCYTELGQPAKAVPLLCRVLERDGDSRAREAALYTSWLAESHLQAGEVDCAGAAAGRVLDHADRGAGSSPCWSRTNLPSRRRSSPPDSSIASTPSHSR